nr:hypothetical protein [Tanacetum cinerariifolium]
DAGFFHVGFRVDHRHVILTAHGHPDLFAVGREKRLVRRTPHVRLVLHGVGFGVDERHRVGADRHRRQGFVVRRKAQPVDQHFTLVQRAQVAGLRVTKADDAKQLVADVNPGAVARRPYAMGEVADGDRSHLLKGVGAVDLHLIEPAHGDISERAVGVVDQVYVVGNRADVQGLEQLERRRRFKDLSFAHVLEGKPDLLAVRRRRDVGAERAGLLHMADDFVIGDGHHHGFRIERRTHVTVFTVRREDLHAGTGRRLDAGFFHV